jgi:hypothetical protein
MNKEAAACVEDAENGARSSNDGGAAYVSDTLRELRALVKLMRKQTRELRRQNDMMGALLEQNAVMIESIVQDAEEDADEPTTYLDGTPIQR